MLSSNSVKVAVKVIKLTSFISDVEIWFKQKNFDVFFYHIQ